MPTTNHNPETGFRSRLKGLLAIVALIPVGTFWDGGFPVAGRFLREPIAVERAAPRMQRAPLVDLSELDQLRSAFVRDRGSLRILALLSPT